MGDLSNLRWLYLQGNLLSGEIPPELGGPSNLESLYLNGNELSGDTPSELGSLSNLEQLGLEENELTGEIPASFLTLDSMWSLTFAWNDGLCAPNTSSFTAWLDGLFAWHGPRCE